MFSSPFVAVIVQQLTAIATLAQVAERARLAMTASILISAQVSEEHTTQVTNLLKQDTENGALWNQLIVDIQRDHPLAFSVSPHTQAWASSPRNMLV